MTKKLRVILFTMNNVLELQPRVRKLLPVKGLKTDVSIEDETHYIIVIICQDMLVNHHPPAMYFTTFNLARPITIYEAYSVNIQSLQQ